MKALSILFATVVGFSTATASSASVLTFSAFNRTSSDVRLIYTDGSTTGYVVVEPGFESVLAVECPPRSAFKTIQTTSFQFDLTVFDSKQIGLLWFVVVAQDRIEVFPHSRIVEPDAEKIVIERPTEPPIVLLGERIKAAQPGATDNPDDAQRLREDH